MLTGYRYSHSRNFKSFFSFLLPIQMKTVLGTTDEIWKTYLRKVFFPPFLCPFLRELILCPEERSTLPFFSGMSVLPQSWRGEHVLCS